jgi:hypothetical protein
MDRATMIQFLEREWNYFHHKLQNKLGTPQSILAYGFTGNEVSRVDS